MSHLMSERPIVVMPSLVMALGFEKAVIAQQIKWLLSQPKSGKVIDGSKWIYNTYEQWSDDFFPFWKPKTIQKHFLELEKMGVLVSCQPEKQNYDRTKYYRIDENKLNELVPSMVYDDRPSNTDDDRPSEVSDSRPSSIYTDISTESHTENPKKLKSENFQIPETLKSITGFEVSWSEWVTYRKQLRKPLTPATIEKQFAFLESQPDPVACINASIINGWQGLFAIKPDKNSTTPPPPAPPAAERNWDEYDFLDPSIPMNGTWGRGN